MSWHRWLRRKNDPAELISQSSAFLCGSLAVERMRRGEIARDWEWLNLLAHGSEVQMLSLALEGLTPRPSSRGDEKWYEAVGFLASQVLDVVSTGRVSLLELQHSVLVPLELELATADHPPAATVPVSLVRVVLDRLNTFLHLHNS